jgi:hypothetical protein
MSASSTTRRPSSPRGRKPSSSRRRRPAAPTGPLANSPALCLLAETFDREKRKGDLERDRQRRRAAAIAHEQAEREEREERQRRDGRHRYRGRNRPRARQERRIVDLLRRGAGITQILREIVVASDGLSDIRRRAVHVDEILDAVAVRDPRTRRIRMTARDLERARAFLGGIVEVMNEGRAPDLTGLPV